MKELNLYLIPKKVEQTERAVYSVQQFSNLIGKPRTVARVYMNRLVKRGLAKNVLKGKISFLDDDFVISAQMFEPSYISLSTALAFHELIPQISAFVECVTTRNSRKYPHLGITYHKISPKLFYGYSKLRKAWSYILIADPEKAVIDSLYFNAIDIDTVKDILPKLNSEKIEKYIKMFKGKGAEKIKRLLL